MMRRAGALFAAALLIHLVLIQPNHPGAMTWGALRLVPLELPVVLGLLLVSRGRALRAALAGGLALLSLLKTADFANFIAYDRAFNPATDLGLIRAGFELGLGTLGPVLGPVVAVLAALWPLVLVWLMWWACGQWARIALPQPARGGAAALTLAAAALMVGQIGAARGAWALPFSPPGIAFSGRLLVDRVDLYRATARERAAFAQAAQADAFAGVSPLFDRLGGRDVVFIFIESYGRASFDNPLYATTHLPTLQAGQAAIAQSPDVAMRSGWMTAPMIGGQSWLAHASVASGLWISNQIRYRALLASPRQSLFHLAQGAGYHTATVVPAITRAWPEGRALGFETILARDDLGYRGLPFNWVTMPDQFTLTAYDRLLGAAARPDARPLFAEISLISSHAPWVPVPSLIDWAAVGDGTAFNAMAQSDDPPDVVWRDHDRVRDQYRRALDYALQVTLSYVARQNPQDMPLFIILGDHQAAAFVSGSASFDVPVHVVGPADLVALIDDWGWTPGLLPDAALPAWSMDLFRDRFLRATSTGAP